MIKMMESTIPEIYSRTLDDECSLVVGASHTDKIATVLFTAVSNCLKELKSKETPVAFTFEDLKGELLAGAIVKFNPSEDAKQPGNWSYVWTFDKADIPDDARVIKISDGLTHSYFVAVAGSKFHMGFESESYLMELMNVFIKVLKKWLTDNADEKEVQTVELDGVFQARVAVEDGEVVTSIEVIGETKAIIKDDKDIEA